MDRSNRFRVFAFALAFAISAVTLATSVPGGAAFVASRLAPPAGDAFERIAGNGAATEVDILPGRIDVIGVREPHTASTESGKGRV